MNSLNRFEILNNCLGYGNENSAIIHLSLHEEGGDWSILNLIKNCANFHTHEEEIKKIYQNKYFGIDDKISKIESLLNVHLLDILDKELLKFKDLNNHILECMPERSKCAYSRTVDFQFQVSKFIINELSPDLRINDINYNTFGTMRGNEVCINLNPVGKNSNDANHDEYEFFFGLKKRQSFPNEKCESQRKEIIKDFLNSKRIDKTSKKYIVIYGSGSLKGMIDEFNLQEFEVDGFEESWFSADTEKRFWWIYHPNARGKKRPDPLNIPFIFNPLSSNRIKKRNESKQ